MLLPPYAAFFAASLLDDRARERCVGLFLALVVLSVLVGVIQVGSAGATFNFYDSAHRGNLIGFFANRNHEGVVRSEEHTSELQSLMRISYAVFCLKKKKKQQLT